MPNVPLTCNISKQLPVLSQIMKAVAAVRSKIDQKMTIIYLENGDYRPQKVVEVFSVTLLLRPDCL